MVLPLKRWKSRSSPGIAAGATEIPFTLPKGRDPTGSRPFCVSGLLDAVPIIGAGWSSPVARQAHNLKVVGSNPTPATNIILAYNVLLTPTAPLAALLPGWHRCLSIAMRCFTPSILRRMAERRGGVRGARCLQPPSPTLAQAAALLKQTASDVLTAGQSKSSGHKPPAVKAACPHRSAALLLGQRRSILMSLATGEVRASCFALAAPREKLAGPLKIVKDPA
jgi:hypothetical protein